jgi:hypothetical protein
LSLVARRLATGRVAAVLINGGPIAIEEARGSLERRDRVLVVDGTGRAADDIAAAVRSRSELHGLGTSDRRAGIVVVGVGDGPAVISQALYALPDDEGKG